MNSFSIIHKLTSKEYRQLSFKLLFSKVWYIIACIIAIIFLISMPLLYFSHSTLLSNDYYWPFGIWIIFFTVYSLISCWLRSGWLFKGNHRLTETITYNISQDSIILTGDSFDSRYTWEKLYKIKIIKGWVMLYHGRTTAHLIKTSTEDEGNIEALKHFIKGSELKIKRNW